MYFIAVKYISWSESALLYAVVLNEAFCNFIDEDIYRKVTGETVKLYC